MARASEPNSASSQFFIVHQDSEFLDGSYAAFGNVTSGIEVVDEICKNVKPQNATTGAVEKDKQPVIESVNVID